MILTMIPDVRDPRLGLHVRPGHGVRSMAPTGCPSHVSSSPGSSSPTPGTLCAFARCSPASPAGRSKRRSASSFATDRCRCCHARRSSASSRLAMLRSTSSPSPRRFACGSCRPSMVTLEVASRDGLFDDLRSRLAAARHGRGIGFESHPTLMRASQGPLFMRCSRSLVPKYRFVRGGAPPPTMAACCCPSRTARWEPRKTLTLGT